MAGSFNHGNQSTFGNIRSVSFIDWSVMVANVEVAVGTVSLAHRVHHLFLLMVSSAAILNSDAVQRRAMFDNVDVSYQSRAWSQVLK